MPKALRGTSTHVAAAVNSAVVAVYDVAADTTSAGGDAHVAYGLSFQLVVYSRDGVTTLTDTIDANPAFGDCSEPADSIQNALREVRWLKEDEGRLLSFHPRS